MYDYFQPWAAELDRAFADDEYPTRLALAEFDEGSWEDLNTTGE